MSVDPYVPLQKVYATDPWRVLVVCMMLNLTSRDQVRPLIERLFARFPNAARMAVAGQDLEEMIRPCGMPEQRARRLRLMSADYLRADVLSPVVVERLHGCGTYAADSFRIFCQGYESFTPGDRVLAGYIDQRRADA